MNLGVSHKINPACTVRLMYPPQRSPGFRIPMTLVVELESPRSAINTQVLDEWEIIIDILYDSSFDSDLHYASRRRSTHEVRLHCRWK